NFGLRWTNNVDVDIFVAVDPRPFEQIFSPNGATFNPSTILFPGFGLQTAPSGGRIPFNHRGGANGGQEICFWPDQFPNGVFGFSALNNSTTTPADVRFHAFLDRDKVPLYGVALAGRRQAARAQPRRDTRVAPCPRRDETAAQNAQPLAGSTRRREAARRTRRREAKPVFPFASFVCLRVFAFALAHRPYEDAIQDRIAPGR